jgi:hypothetical protein
LKQIPIKRNYNCRKQYGSFPDKKPLKTTNIEQWSLKIKVIRELWKSLKVNKLFNENSPKSLGSYSYKSYEKISLDIDEDSLTSSGSILMT